MRTTRPTAQGDSGPRPVYSRALLTPGPLRPLSPLGITLLGQIATSGLRYALYHLGLPLPEAPPFQAIRQRLYLEGRGLRRLLSDVPGGEDVLAALLEPGGIGERPATAPSLMAAVGFHRVRLNRFLPPESRGPALRGDETPEELLNRLRTELSRPLLRLGDALLADLIAALGRRSARATGEDVPPVLSGAAWRLRTGRKADLHLFGPPDLLLPSWADRPERAEEARRVLARHPVPGHDRFRGRFREAWRSLLDRLAPYHRALAESAVEHGHLAAPEDAFFLPFDRLGDLAQPEKSPTLQETIRTLRAEHENLLRTAEPLDLLTEKQEMAPVEEERPEWDWAPLLPLP